MSDEKVWWCKHRNSYTAEPYVHVWADWKENCVPTATMDKGSTREWEDAERNHRDCCWRLVIPLPTSELPNEGGWWCEQHDCVSTDGTFTGCVVTQHGTWDFEACRIIPLSNTETEK